MPATGPPAGGDMTLGRGAPPGGAPCLPRWTACILASISCETLRPLPLLEMVGAFGGRGFLAALMFPSGVEEVVIFAVAPDVDIERGAGRAWSREVLGEALGLISEGTGGDGEEGEGESKGESESKSSPGVEGAAAMVHRAIGAGRGGSDRTRRRCCRDPAVRTSIRRVQSFVVLTLGAGAGAGAVVGCGCG